MQCLTWQKISLRHFRCWNAFVLYKRYERRSFLHFWKIYEFQQSIKNLWPKTRTKTCIYLDANCLYGYAISKFYPTDPIKGKDSKEFDLNKYSINNLKGCVLEIDLEYPEKLRELHNDYPLAQNKIEIKKEILSNIK